MLAPVNYFPAVLNIGAITVGVCDGPGPTAHRFRAPKGFGIIEQNRVIGVKAESKSRSEIASLRDCEYCDEMLFKISVVFADGQVYVAALAVIERLLSVVKSMQRVRMILSNLRLVFMKNFSSSLGNL